ncbi:alpha-ketoglutarate-dependent dioxygenase AlkB [Robbsia andropogonis]|uniref:alpha-ketoglutarate-dependent dioxygenase AlkB n=1 Tax=Robbsia andropogonis TaxID=28092 RepID=UPI002A6A11AC|nr:alpha-ketoglutarate-dependent dioxygenase AlkB [Robbsia andropogonis]
MARNFTDMEVPSQPFKVGVLSQVAPPEDAPPRNSTSQPPPNWNALRGAAAMAAFAVPVIDPWIELFCDLLCAGVANSESVEKLHAPWWRVALWVDSAEQEQLPGLWRAIVVQFSQPGRLNEWRAKTILSDICEKARGLGEDETRLAKLSEGAMALLNDKGTVQDLGAHDDFLALTLQLLLLRPSPEKFSSWREGWPAIPPLVWWTGMTLAGYLQGYGSLPTQFRGSTECRKLLALKTWQQAGTNGSGPWHALTPDNVAWRVDDGVVVMTADSQTWAEHRLGTRGSWYRAAFEDPAVQLEAQALALEECPNSLEQLVVVENATIQLSGDGVFKVQKESALTVSGRIEFALGQGVTLERRLNQPRFKEWLATAGITRRLVRPSSTLPRQDGDAFPPRTSANQASSTTLPKKLANKRASKLSTKSAIGPVGLQVLPNFITDDEEHRLVTIIDSVEWDQLMKRRVQHYGWRYDYKARQITQANYLGPLPRWAEDLAERLLASGVVPELPDQVIVNNYEGNQGISKHIDCKDCFRGPVVTISLLETWDMVFTRKIAVETEKFIQSLTRCSAVVLDGEARSAWHHEIPTRLTERGVRRGRRISITFRKVAI